MHNQFTARPEVIFITYNEIIRNPYPYLLSVLIEKYKHVYQDFLDVDKLIDKDIRIMERLCTQRQEKNIFREFSIREFDFDGGLKEFEELHEDMYLEEQVPLLEIGKQIGLLMSQKFTDKIYFYTPEFDLKTYVDIQKTFHDMTKIRYVYGDFIEAIEMIEEEITTFILNDIELVPDIFFMEKANYTNILIAEHGYNYYFDDNSQELKLKVDMGVYYENKDLVFSFATFKPLKMTEEHFSDLNLFEPE